MYFITYIDLTSVMYTIYAALAEVVAWSNTHGIHLFDWYITFFELWCGVLIGGILLSFVVYDDDGATDVEE